LTQFPAIDVISGNFRHFLQLASFPAIDKFCAKLTPFPAIDAISGNQRHFRQLTQFPAISDTSGN
jgi:hypothetical protein